jgi:hypothetical protein
MGGFMNKTIATLFFCYIASFAEANTAMPVLQKGVSLIDDNIMDASGKLFYRLGKCGTWDGSGCPKGTKFIRAYINPDKGPLYIAVKDDAKVYLIDTKALTLTGGWDMLPNRHALLEPELIPFLKKKEKTFGKSETRLAAIGSLAECGRKDLLQYGDFTGDGKPELFVAVGDNHAGWYLTIFSLEKQAPIFIAHLDFNDVSRHIIEEDGMLREFDGLPKDPQYNSTVFYDDQPDKQNEKIPGYLSTGVIFYGDIDNNKIPDIVYWNKLYVSRLFSDPIKGLRLVREKLEHWELADGTFVKKSSDTPKLKSALAAKKLTWRQGYPNDYLCNTNSGNDPDHLPYSPFLNDPDVLQ